MLSATREVKLKLPPYHRKYQPGQQCQAAMPALATCFFFVQILYIITPSYILVIYYYICSLLDGYSCMPHNLNMINNSKMPWPVQPLLSSFGNAVESFLNFTAIHQTTACLLKEATLGIFFKL